MPARTSFALALALSLALSASCGQPPPRPSPPAAAPARVSSAAPSASASAVPVAPAEPPPSFPGVPGFPGALARFGSLTHRIPDSFARVYAFDSGAVWSAEGATIRDVATNDIVMKVEGCAAFDILPSGDRLACLKRAPSRVEVLRIPTGKVESSLPLGVGPKTPPKPKPARLLADLNDHVELTVTESNGLRAIIAGKQVTISAPPFKVTKVENAPSPFAAAFSANAEPIEDPAANRLISPNGTVRAIVDKQTLGVTIVKDGKHEGYDGWAPVSMPIGAAWLSEGGFVLWYGTSWERVDRTGELVSRGDFRNVRHYMLNAFVHGGKDGAFVGVSKDGDTYEYRLMTPELSPSPVFRADRCLAQVPGTTTIVCSDIRKPATRTADAEGDIVLLDALTGAERARRALTKDHLSSALVAADGAILVELGLTKREILNKDLSVAVASLDATIEGSKKLGAVAGLLPGHAVLFRTTREPGLWVIEGETFRPVFVEPGAKLSGIEPSPDGKRVAVAVHRGRETELLVLEAATGKSVARFVAPLGSYVSAIAFDARGERILTAAQGIVWIWDATSRGSL